MSIIGKVKEIIQWVAPKSESIEAKEKGKDKLNFTEKYKKIRKWCTCPSPEMCPIDKLDSITESLINEITSDISKKTYLNLLRYLCEMKDCEYKDKDFYKKGKYFLLVCQTCKKVVAKIENDKILKQFENSICPYCNLPDLEFIYMDKYGLTPNLNMLYKNNVNQIQNLNNLITGYKKIDKFLGGGLRKNTFNTLIYLPKKGKPYSKVRKDYLKIGKGLCVSSCLPKKLGGLGKECLYMASSGNIPFSLNSGEGYITSKSIKKIFNENYNIRVKESDIDVNFCPLTPSKSLEDALKIIENKKIKGKVIIFDFIDVFEKSIQDKSLSKNSQKILKKIKGLISNTETTVVLITSDIAPENRRQMEERFRPNDYYETKYLHHFGPTLLTRRGKQNEKQLFSIKGHPNSYLTGKRKKLDLNFNGKA